mgnify:CR=1 FL=1
MKQKRTMTRWTVEDSADLYQIREWGAGYFSISEDGDVIVTPLKDLRANFTSSRENCPPTHLR